MITIWKTGEYDYKDADIDKPVKYIMDNLIEVASRTPRMNVTKEHSKDVVGEMSNFIVEDGLLKADEPNNLNLSGMGFSPVFEFDLIDMGDYYVPKNIVMTEIGYTKTPRSKIVYNSIEVQNEDRAMDDKQLRDALDNNKKLILCKLILTKYSNIESFSFLYFFYIIHANLKNCLPSFTSVVL